MEKINIGKNAGLIWLILDAAEELSITELKTKSGLNNEEIYTAIGWLARESKIYTVKRNEKVYISNKSIAGFSFFG